MNDLQIFENEVFGKIRTLGKDGEPWFVGKDVAEALGYERPTKAIQDHVDTEDKDEVPIQDSIGRMQNTPIINESGLYSLVLSSKLPSAKQFKRWVTSDILPAIRKYGGFLTPEKVEEVLLNPDTIIRLATDLKSEREQRKALEIIVETQRPKVLFADSVSASKTSILIGDLAKILKQNGIDIGQKRLFHWLREKGWLIRQKGNSYNMPTQKGMEQGYFEIKETVITHSDGHVTISKTPKITGRGQVFFVHLFLSKQSQMAWISDSQAAMV